MIRFYLVTTKAERDFATMIARDIANLGAPKLVKPGDAEPSNGER